MLSNKMNDKSKTTYKRLSFRLPIALLLTAILFLWAATRPLDVGHDTTNYVGIIKDYIVPDSERFPDLIFNAIATATATFFYQIPGGTELSGRFFLVLIAFIESIFFFLILKRKKYTLEAILLAFSYGPFMFLDILRQGLSMLLAGVFFSGNRRKPLYFIGALSTHVVSVIALLNIPLNKKNLFSYAILLIITGMLTLILIDEIVAKYEYYSITEGFLSNADVAREFSWDSFSVANLFVIMFFFYGAAVGGFTKFEALILFALYLVSIYLPLFYRFYIFYFFCLSCSKDVLINSKNIKYIIFNMLYAVVLLRFSLSAFIVFDVGR